MFSDRVQCNDLYLFILGYIRRSDLVVHMRFHKKERVFACPYCVDKKFCQSGLYINDIPGFYKSMGLC